MLIEILKLLALVAEFLGYSKKNHFATAAEADIDGGIKRKRIRVCFR